MRFLLALLTALLMALAICAQELDSVMLRRMDSISSLFNIGEITVKAEMPKTYMRGDAQVTRVAGSVLAVAGSAEDALSKVPGLINRNGQLEVIGKGSPVYYINGRRVQDVSELQRLRSSDIREVEVIANPGAQYGGDVTAVVRIKTNPQEGEGFGFTLDAYEDFCPRYLNNRFHGKIGMQYVIRGVNIYANLGDDDERLQHFDTDIHQSLFDTDYTFDQSIKQEYAQRYNTLNYTAGLDWQINENHIIGARLERRNNLRGVTNQFSVDSTRMNGAEHDYLISETVSEANGPDYWSAQAYYTGKAGKLGIDARLDYFGNKQIDDAYTTEVANISNREISTYGEAVAHMAAGKLTMNYPLKYGELSWGTEVAILKRINLYHATLQTKDPSSDDYAIIPDNQTTIREDNYAAFIGYGISFEKAGMLNLGLRYELTRLNYKGVFDDENEEYCEFKHHVYPSLSFLTRIGEVQGSIAYAIKSKRPQYHMLRSTIEYHNRYTLSCGNPELIDEINQDATLNARWRWISGAILYEYKKNGIFDWSFPYDEPGQIMMTWVNLSEPIHRLSAFINLSPTVGTWSSAPDVKIWQPSLTLGVQKQWLRSEVFDPREESGTRTIRYNRPMWIAEWHNAFYFPSKKGSPWVTEINGDFFSGGHWGNAELIGGNFNLSVALQKSWLKHDALSLRLQVNDLCHTAKQTVRLDMGNYLYTQSRLHGEQRSLYDPQTITLTLRYTFNSFKTPRNHSGAGEEVRSRM